MRLRALAKINLGLDVLRKREDGYHELRMIMQTINMYDQLDIEISKTPGIKITTNLPFIPVNESNLVYKAAKLLMDEFQVEQGITVDLQKFIPVAAGMAGGDQLRAAEPLRPARRVQRRAGRSAPLRLYRPAQGKDPAKTVRPHREERQGGRQSPPYVRARVVQRFPRPRTR